MILVADPARLTADLLCRRLRADGFNALSFATAPGLFSRASASDVEAIIVDPALGGGAGLIPRIRTVAPAAPIIAFGTSDRPQDVSAALSAGANAFLVKGRVTPTQLVARLRELLASASPAPLASDRPTGATDGSYYVQVDARFGDAARLGADTGSAPGMCCCDCGAAMTLYLQRDTSRWGKWLFGTFGCLSCARRKSAAPPLLDMEPLALAAGGSR